MNRKRPDNEKMADEAAAIKLLANYDVDARKNVTRARHNSGDERKLRAALARCVRDQMNGFAGELLALAIDPWTPSKIPTMRSTVNIKFVRQGRLSSLFVESQVIDYIRRLRFNSTEPHDQKFYVMSAVNEFNKRGIKIKKSTVHRIWSEHEKMLDEAARQSKK